MLLLTTGIYQKVSPYIIPFWIITIGIAIISLIYYYEKKEQDAKRI